MTIRDRKGRNLLQIWKCQDAVIGAEFSAGNIGVWFTGRVSSYSEIELILARGQDQISISLLGASCTVRDVPSKLPEGFRRVVMITTDADATCTLFECDPHTTRPV